MTNLSKSELQLRVHNYKNRVEALTLAMVFMEASGVGNVEMLTLEIMKAEYETKLKAASEQLDGLTIMCSAELDNEWHNESL